MSLELILVSVCCAISLVNLFSTIFLSNAVFRLLVANQAEKDLPVPPTKEKGLVDLREVPTYDPRFRDRT